MHPYFVGWAVNAHVDPTSALSGAEGSTLSISLRRPLVEATGCVGFAC
jgi:hypothetical protein